MLQLIPLAPSLFKVNVRTLLSLTVRVYSVIWVDISHSGSVDMPSGPSRCKQTHCLIDGQYEPIQIMCLHSLTLIYGT